MKALPSILALSATALALTGCVDRATADAKLVTACSAGIEAFLPESDDIQKINNQNLTNHPDHGKGYRLVELDVTVSDGFHARDESHSCIFLEEFSVFNLSHNASIYQLNYGGQIIGQQNYEIQGSLQDMTKLTNAVDAALQ